MTRLFEAKPFIVCEVGSNWRTREDCLESIGAAKVAGADAVKFQAFSHKALYGYPGNMVLKSELPLAWLPTLAASAKAEGLEFMCTAFSPELVKAVDPYVSVHKIASSDAACPFMHRAVKATGKPYLVSYGAKSVADIQAVNDMVDYRAIALLCVAAYPASFVDLDLLDAGYQGLSDHTLGFTTAVEAARRGAMVIEKHFTAFPDMATPDRPHSLTPQEFRRMVDVIRTDEITVGPTCEETGMLLRHNRRLIATRDVRKGELLKLGHNFGSYRALQDEPEALAPYEWEKAEGKRATRNIARGKGVRLGDCA